MITATSGLDFGMAHTGMKMSIFQLSILRAILRGGNARKIDRAHRDDGGGQIFGRARAATPHRVGAFRSR